MLEQQSRTGKGEFVTYSPRGGAYRWANTTATSEGMRGMYCPPVDLALTDAATRGSPSMNTSAQKANTRNCRSTLSMCSFWPYCAAGAAIPVQLAEGEPPLQRRRPPTRLSKFLHASTHPGGRVIVGGLRYSDELHAVIAAATPLRPARSLTHHLRRAVEPRAGRSETRGTRARTSTCSGFKRMSVRVDARRTQVAHRAFAWAILMTSSLLSRSSCADR